MRIMGLSWRLLRICIIESAAKEADRRKEMEEGKEVLTDFRGVSDVYNRICLAYKSIFSDR